MEKIPDALARAKVLDEKSQETELGAVLRDRTSVVVFLRHFG